MTQFTGPDEIVNELLILNLGEVGVADMFAHGLFPLARLKLARIHMKMTAGTFVDKVLAGLTEVCRLNY